MPLVPLVTNSGPSASLYAPAAGGGGGGGGGPNPQVSTLSVNDSGNVLMTWNNGGATLNFGFEATNTSSFNIQQGSGVQQSRITGPEGCLQFVEQDGSVFGYAPVIASGIEIATGAFPGQASAGLYSGNNTSILYSINQPMLLDAPAGVSISSLSVSSINGAAPGGSAGPDPVVSSLTFSTTGAINMTGQLVIQDSTTPVVQDYLFQTNQPTSSLGALSSFLSTANLFAVIGPGGDGNNGTIAMLASADGRALLQSGVGDSKSTLTLYADSVNVPFNLNVSSINNAAPGGGSVYPLPSTLKSGDSTGLSINASSLTTLAAYSTISSHFYTISVDLLPKELTQTFGPNDGFQTQLTTEGGLVNILNDGLWSQISTLNNLNITPGLGGSATFKADGTNFTIDIYSNYASTLSTNLNAIFAVDHGPGN